MAAIRSLIGSSDWTCCSVRRRKCWATVSDHRLDTDCGGANRVGVNGDDGVDVVRVAAAHRDGDRQRRRAGSASSTISSRARRPSMVSLSRPEPIALDRDRRRRDRRRSPVDAGSDTSSRCEPQQLDRYSSSPVPSGNATSRSLTSFRNGKFFSPCIENVNTDRVAREDGRGAVALVHVAGRRRRSRARLRDRAAARAPPTATSLNTQKPSPRSAKRVVRAAGQVGRHAVLERGARRRDRRADRSPRALDHLRRPRKADAPLRRRAAACRSATAST